MADLTINLAVAGAEVVTGALRRVGEVAINALGAALGKVADFASDSFKGALEAQQGIDAMDAALARLQSTSSAQAAEFAKASQTMVTGTAASQSQLDKWGTELSKAQAKLIDMQNRLGDKAPTETQKIQLQELQNTVATLTQNIETGSRVITTNLADSLGLVAPAATITRDEILKLSDQFKNLVGGSDDAVIAMATVGLRFDKISKDTFPDFIKRSADLAAVLKVDPVKASEILGKALQDLSVDGVGSIGRLKAAGVAFTDEQEKLIKKLVESGDVAGAQKVLFDALAETTGGAAAAAADTLQGKWAIFLETIADAGEGVALKLLPVLTQLADAVLPKLLPVVEEVADALSGFIEMLAVGNVTAAVESAFGGLEAIFEALGVSTQDQVAIFSVLWDVFDQTSAFVQTVLIPAFQQAVAWVQANWPMIQATIADVWAQAQPILQAVWDFIQTVVIPAFNSAVQWVITNWPMIQATIATVMAQIQAVIQTILTAIQAFWNEWGDEITAYVQAFIDNVQVIFSAFSAAFEGDWRKFGEILRVAWDEAWQNIQSIVAAAIDWFNTQDWGAIGSAILQGIADGITAGAQWVIDAATAAAKAAVDAVKGFLGVQSPSKVFAGIGQNMMAGMAEGVTAGIAQPVGAVRTASAAVANSVVNNSGGNTYNYYGVQADMQSAYNRAVAGALA